MQQDLSALESAVYVGLCNRGLNVPLLSRLLHISWRHIQRSDAQAGCIRHPVSV